MPETPRDVAELWAGPHDRNCKIFILRHGKCDCSRRERVAAIEAAIREAEQRGRTAGVEAEFKSHEAEVLELTRTHEDEVAKAREEGRSEGAAWAHREVSSIKLVDERIAEARRQGREEILVHVRDLTVDPSWVVLHNHAWARLKELAVCTCPEAREPHLLSCPARALSLEGSGEEGR